MKKIILILAPLLLFGLSSCDNNLESIKNDKFASVSKSRELTSESYVILYEHSNFRGASEIFYLDNKFNRIVRLNNRVSSMKIVGNIRAQLFDSENGGGIYTYQLTEDVANFTDIAFNDIASYIMIERHYNNFRPVHVHMYDDRSGGSFESYDMVPGKVYNLKHNKEKVSIIVVEGQSIVTMYAADGSFTQVFAGGTDLKDIAFDNRAVSISVDKPKQGYVIAYDRSDYAGSEVEFEKNYRVLSYPFKNMRSLNFDNKTSSIQAITYNGGEMKFYHHIRKLSDSRISERFPVFRPMRGNCVLGRYGYNNQISAVSY